MCIFRSDHNVGKCLWSDVMIHIMHAEMACKYHVGMWSHRKREELYWGVDRKKQLCSELPLDGSSQSCWASQWGRVCPPWNRSPGPRRQSRVPANSWRNGRPSSRPCRSPSPLGSCTLQAPLWRGDGGLGLIESDWKSSLETSLNTFVETLIGCQRKPVFMCLNTEWTSSSWQCNSITFCPPLGFE